MKTTRSKYAEAVFELQKARDTIRKLERENEMLSEEVANKKKSLDSANEEIKLLCTRLDKAMDEAITPRKKNNDSLVKSESRSATKSQIKIQNGSKIKSDEKFQLKKDKSPTAGNQNDEFEVEQILDDKKVRTGRKFLVRWKGFDADHDLWVHENDLKCPKILKKYLNKKNECN